MKAFVALMLFSVAQLMENSHAALPNVGVCTFRQYTNMERSCMTTFFQGFRKDPHADCSAKFTSLFGCFTTAILKCRTTWSESQARDVLEAANIKEKRFCEDAGTQDPALQPNKNIVPCSQAYFQKAIGCANKTLTLFRSNKGDTRLCSAYAEAIKCEKSLIEKECRYTGASKELMDLYYDGYNPFCEPSTSREKNAVPSHLPKGLTFLIWAALCTSVLW